MKHYETIFIANPNLGDEEYGEILKKFSNLIEKLKGVIVKVDEWGKQKLAYPLKKFDSGVYVLIEYCSEPGMTTDLERNLKLDERVLKYQTVKLADQADPEALIQKERETREERKSRAAETSEEEVYEEGRLEHAGTPEEGSESEGPVEPAEYAANAGEAQEEIKKESAQKTNEASEEETPVQNEGEKEDLR